MCVCECLRKVLDFAQGFFRVFGLLARRIALQIPFGFAKHGREDVGLGALLRGMRVCVYELYYTLFLNNVKQPLYRFFRDT